MLLVDLRASFHCLMSTARSTVFHGGSTLRINLCVSEISIHKDGAKYHFFVIGSGRKFPVGGRGGKTL